MKMNFKITNRFVIPAQVGIFCLFIAILFVACTVYDNYDIDMMQDATASVESSSGDKDAASAGSSSSEQKKDESSSSKKLEPPAFSNKNPSFSVDENATVGTAIGTVKVSNAVGSEKFSIVGEVSLFGIDEKTGAISVKKAEIDYEKKSEYSIKVAVANSEGKDTATVSISVTDVNEKPSVTAAAFTVAENSASGTLVGTVVADDPDVKNLAFGKITYSLVDSTAGASSLFKIDDSGRITVAQNADLNFERTSLYYVKVIVKDKEFSDTAVVSIQLTDVEEPESSSSAASSSSSAKSSSSVSTWTCGDSTLTRGDRTYKTVLIGEQCWTQENMNYEPSSGKTLCYGGNEANCATYGLLYNYEAAEGACPSGWRLPTASEYDAIAGLTLARDETIDDDAGRHLKASSGWNGENGDDNIGFTALPAGKCDEEKDCEKVGSFGYWWSSTAVGTYAHKTLNLTGDNDGFSSSFGFANEEFASVRCVKK